MKNSFARTIFLTASGAKQAIKIFSPFLSFPLNSGENQPFQYELNALVAYKAGINEHQYNVVAMRTAGQILCLEELCKMNGIKFDARQFDHIVN